MRKLDYSSFDKFVQSYLAGAKAQNGKGFVPVRHLQVHYLEKLCMSV